ncbi:MAG: hypothetical protein Q4P07_01725 [Ornithinimicrobium sp.]|uniref:hypothetical protein n=1 Tax=Ornithinimicrobium sp. TaxID=1977084 RepID=UPI0026DF3AE5|nr:hypothetical protein [Ornithinimicrobium sp.]MDO5738852.1 hypothetical protein [Ornithinimicrobium sp.]
MTSGANDYLDPATMALLVGGMVTALVALVAGLNGRAPGRITVGLMALLQAGALAYAAIYLLRQVRGESPVGPLWELWAYLLTILVLPALSLIWAREEPSRWSTFVLAVAAFTTAVMAARCAQIWHGVGMLP